jgi:hypothetical protein
VNQALLSFFNQHYAPGRVGLLGQDDLKGTLIRAAEASLTTDGRPSRWSHTFLFGERRRDGRTDGSIYIFESDLSVSVRDWEVQNGAMESRVVKWCLDDVSHGCVLGMDLTPAETAPLLTQALAYAYDEDHHLRYPVGELFGTLWAILTRRLSQKNIFTEQYAVQCAGFVRLCYQAIGKDPVTGPVDLTNTSPESFYRSRAFTFRQEWHR